MQMQFIQDMDFFENSKFQKNLSRTRNQIYGASPEMIDRMGDKARQIDYD
jgi:biotin carboxylase